MTSDIPVGATNLDMSVVLFLEKGSKGLGHHQSRVLLELSQVAPLCFNFDETLLGCTASAPTTVTSNVPVGATNLDMSVVLFLEKGSKGLGQHQSRVLPDLSQVPPFALMSINLAGVHHKCTQQQSVASDICWSHKPRHSYCFVP